MKFYANDYFLLEATVVYVFMTVQIITTDVDTQEINVTVEFRSCCCGILSHCVMEYKWLWLAEGFDG